MNFLRNEFRKDSFAPGRQAPTGKDMDIKIGDRVYKFQAQDSAFLQRPDQKIYGTVIWKHPKHHFVRVKFDVGYIEGHSCIDDEHKTIFKVGR